MPLDYSGQNLRGRSFKGQDLSGANFSGSDIRGANLTGAILKDANFQNAKAGLQRRWVIFLVAISCLLSAVSGFCSLIVGVLVVYILSSSNLDNQITGWTTLIVLIVFFIVTIRQGIGEAFTGAGVGVIAIAVTIAFTVTIAGAVAIAFTGIVSFAGAIALAGTIALAGAFTGAIAGAVAIAFTGIVSFAGAIAGAISFTKVVNLAFTGAGNIARDFASSLSEVFPGAFVEAVAFAGAIALFSTFIAWRAVKGDEKHGIIRNIAVAFAATGGTNFRNVNLTDANFTGAILKNTDFRNANLTRTCFRKTKKLDLVRPGISYLQNTQVRQLLVTRQVIDKNLDGEKLRGVNFQGANLVDASFIGADLSEANLQDADLSRAVLKQTQLDETDFTGATLTGAIIEDWGITNTTNFNGVRCEYVYMRLPTKENPDPLRKPDNNSETFADGEFGDFIQPIFDTLDLYHNQDIDPRAIAISFKQLAENNPEAELRIVGMEVRGEDKFLLRAKTAPEANKSELSAEYFDIYNHVKVLAQKEIQALMAEKDNRIASLENMVNTALQRPNFYSSTQIEEVSNINNNPGGFSVGGSVGGNINNVQGDGNRTVQGDNNQVIQGDGNQVGVDTKAPLSSYDIVKLLEELESLVLKAELPKQTKEELSEEISAAKKATNKEEPKKNIALANLESVAQTLEKTSKTVDAGQKLWSKAKPIIVKIATWLGAAAGSHLLG